MLLIYNNDTVLPVSINKHLTDQPVGRDVGKQRNYRLRDESEDSALVNFFRQVENKPLVLPLMGTVVKFDRKAAQQLRLQDQTPQNVTSLKQVSNELLARLNKESQNTEVASATDEPQQQAEIYKYRSRAKITHYNLPRLAANG